MHADPLAAGVAHFNALRFWEAHEAWEELWLEAEDESVDFLQGLIQLAAAYHHMRRGTFRGASRLFEAGLNRLSRFPSGFLGVGRDAAVEAAVRHRACAASGTPISDDDYPKLAFTGT